MTVDISPRAGRREWVGLAVLALPCMLYSMDLTVLNLAIPELARDLRPTASQLLWIIDIYGFMVAGFLMVMGSLGDRLGRRRILLIGAAAFGAASVLAAFAQTAEQLIAARAVLGIAGATLAPSTLSLITSMFRDEGQRTFAISIWIMSFSVGALIGPVAGGLLIQYFWWGAVFLAGVPIMVLLLILGPLLLPEYRDPNAGRIDFASALLSLAAVLSLIYGVKHWADVGVDGQTLLALGAGALLVVVFLRRQRRIANPLVDLALFRSRQFSLALTVNTVAVFFMFGIFIFVAQYLQLVLGMAPLEAGLWSLPGAVAFTLAAPFTARLAERFPAVQVMTGGLLMAVVGFVVMGLAQGLFAVVAANILIGVGFTPVMALTTGFVVGAAPVEKAGIASAMSETGSELGGATGVALLGSLLTAVYRARMADAPVQGLPPDLAMAAQATLAGAVEAAQQVPAAAGLLAEGRAAFTDAFHMTAFLAALALAALALLVLRVLSSATPQPAGH
ncbi:MFS transporter [Fertoeibacter niger]|nr:MFS transporter [Fertoeibacter niger]